MSCSTTARCAMPAISGSEPARPNRPNCVAATAGLQGFTGDAGQGRTAAQPDQRQVQLRSKAPRHRRIPFRDGTAGRSLYSGRQGFHRSRREPAVFDRGEWRADAFRRDGGNRRTGCRHHASGPDRGGGDSAGRPAEADHPGYRRSQPAGGGGRRHDNPRGAAFGGAGAGRLEAEVTGGNASRPHQPRRVGPAADRRRARFFRIAAACGRRSLPGLPPGYRRTSTMRSGGCRRRVSAPMSR